MYVDRIVGVCAVVDAFSGFDFDFSLFSALNVRLNDAKSCAFRSVVCVLPDCW